MSALVQLLLSKKLTMSPFGQSRLRMHCRMASLMSDGKLMEQPTHVLGMSSVEADVAPNYTFYRPHTRCCSSQASTEPIEPLNQLETKALTLSCIYRYRRRGKSSAQN